MERLTEIPDVVQLRSIPKDERPRFVKGGKPGPGRPKGATNEVMKDAKEFARHLVNNPKYRDKLRTALESRKLEIQMEVMLWSYAYGKPKETMDINWNLERLSEQELDTLESLVRRVS